MLPTVEEMAAFKSSRSDKNLDGNRQM